MSDAETEIRPSSRRTERGERSRAAILEAATRLATVEGLEGLSIGRLADELGMSKSGLYAHFRSKEDLQLAAIDTAGAIYSREIVGPALEAEPGLARLLRLCDRFLDFIGSGVFPGGCFFIYNSLDPAGSRAAVRERLASAQRDWLALIEQFAQEAIDRGEVAPDPDARTRAFEVDAILIGADANYVLLRDPAFLDRARAAIRRLLAPAPPPH